MDGIEAISLCKKFGPFAAVSGVSFAVPQGEVLGFLGPNGAGKSTTMKMLTGFLPPTSGAARVCGHDVAAEPLAAKRALGYLPERGPLYGEMTTLEFLHFIGRARNLGRAARRDAIERVLALCRIGDMRHRLLGTLSKGYRQRVGLAQALLHDPPCLILDEPTDGLDPNQKDVVRALIRSMRPTKAIILSTHILEEVEALCSRVIIINRGRLLADATPENLRIEHGSMEQAFRTITQGGRNGAGDGRAPESPTVPVPSARSRS
jgi:ABC-2 type transport system ATP-binding protein